MSRRQWSSLAEVVRAVEDDDLDSFMRQVESLRSPNENLPLVSFRQIGFTFTPLLYACRLGRSRLVQHLLTVPGVNTEACDNYGFNALTNAIHSGNTELFRRLSRTVPPVLDRQGNTCLHHGVMANDLEIVKTCLHNLRLSVFDKNIEGQTALHLANSEGVAVLLIEAGANLGETDKNGWTPLHHAAYNGLSEVVACLIQRGATVAAADADGHTPQDLAAEHSANAETLEVLRRYAFRRSSTECIGEISLEEVQKVKGSSQRESVFEEVESIGSNKPESSMFEEVESINSSSVFQLVNSQSLSESGQSPDEKPLAKSNPTMSPQIRSILSELLLKTTSNIDFSQLKFYGVETIKYSEIRLREEIGRGAYGKVHRAYFRDNQVAVKVSHIEQVTERSVAEFMKEIQNLIQIRHPRFLLLLAICVEGPLCILTELAKGGNLSDSLKRQRIQDNDKLRIALQIAEGMNYIHNKDPPIVHRDLKPQNILLDSFLQVKIADLGLSRAMGTSANTMRLEDTELFAGTVRYMAPELFDEEPSCSRATDVWSFGCILHQLFTNELPWNSLELAGVQRRLVLKQPFPISPAISDDVKTLVADCTNLDPRLRPRFNQIIASLEVMSGVPQSLPQ